MGIYLCGGCGEIKDDDFSGCTEGPDGEGYCDECVTERTDLFDDEGEAIAAENEAISHQWYEQMDSDKGYQERMK